MEYTWHYESPLGGITLTCEDTALTGLWFDDGKYTASTPGTVREQKLVPVLEETVCWLDMYFSGREPDFTPPLCMNFTPFRRRVQEILLSIPWGQTMTYAQIAERIASERHIEKMSARAVGGAVGHNNILLIIPCHRVTGSDGSLTGYAGGISRKRKLLELEGVKTAGERKRQSSLREQTGRIK